MLEPSYQTRAEDPAWDTVGSTLTNILGACGAIAASTPPSPSDAPWVAVDGAWVPIRVEDARMGLRAGGVHVWRADLDGVAGRFEGLLDRGELARGERIVGKPARRRWMAARGALRAVLGAYMEGDPATLKFASGRHGKPKLFPFGGLHFNASHSGAVAVYALTEICPVGIDVEAAERPDRRRRSSDFLREWVLAEAEGKRTGMGVGNTRALPHVRRWDGWISGLELGGGAVGAIALARAPVDFRVYEIDF
jgi:4'-phosphopantetheinyl transferase